MDISFPVVAGGVSTTIFAISALPMLVKAARTRDLGSYSLGNILLSNLGNVIHSVYVFHLPPGPVWVLHTFYLVSTGLMLFWYLRYAVGPRAALGAVARWIAALNRQARRLGRTTHRRALGGWAVLPKQPPFPRAHSELIDSIWRG